MPYMHDPTLRVTDNAIAGWAKLCPELDMAAELKEQPWTMLHERSPDKRLGAYWMLPCGIIAVIKKTIWQRPNGRTARTSLQLVKFLTPKQCRKARSLPEPKIITLTPEQDRQRSRRHEKNRRKRRQAEKARAAEAANVR